MHKKLKKRILEACGINNQLSKEERFEIASSILSDYDHKQRICNILQGVSYKDIEKALKQFTEEFSNLHQSEDEIEQLENTEKFQYEYEETPEQVIIPKEPRVINYTTYTREQVAWLLNQTAITPDEEPTLPPAQYDTYYPEEVAALFACNYNPEHFKYLRKKKNKT